ncbi:M1 family metallopeptidase [Streptomyces sp. NPDC058045]|uniref:M1 family metallopeptidase n=1 Tax=Streptomyces sp. NPDC058045 TaxID=3346311 RepID=UPI0036EFE48B
MPHTPSRLPAVRPGRAPRLKRTAAALVAAATSGCLLAAWSPPPAAPTPQGLGDRLFPQLGNPGYDVTDYDIALRYRGRNDRPLSAVTRIDARATAQLARVNLDFTHGKVRSVDVNGRAARFATAGEDLVISPARVVPRGAPLRITVRHTSDPRPARGSEGGWVQTRDGLAMANQADAAHRVFPCNDHPSDKARFTFRVTAPKRLTVVAGGLPTGRTRHGADTTWTYRGAHPTATELAQVSIGRSTVLRRTGPHGLPVRDVVPTADRAALAPWLRRTPGQLAWLERRLGRYPFENYGLLVADARTGFELETQTLSLFEKRLFTDARYPSWYVASLMVHELTHQWFGDTVTPRTWSDVWLNEGHATWYEALYGQGRGGPSLDRRMHEAYLQSDTWRAAGGPPARPALPDPGRKISIFRPVVYDGSALVLYALRQKIGARAFDRLERLWIETHRDGNAATSDFVDLASAVAGRDLTGFLHAWLYDRTTPPMPGHPKWRQEASAQARRS